MWNPLTLPGLVIGATTEIVRALLALPEALASLERRLAQVDRLAEQSEVMTQLLEQTKATADGIRQLAEPILQGSMATRDMLDRTQRELAELNRRLEKLLAEPPRPPEPVSPAEPAPQAETGRRGRFAFRRSSAPQT